MSGIDAGRDGGCYRGCGEKRKVTVVSWENWPQRVLAPGFFILMLQNWALQYVFLVRQSLR